ncbi:nicotinate-nucleotide pyrophosphorylase [carboxylating], chloroplastic [Tanacetum coccineum]
MLTNHRPPTTVVGFSPSVAMNPADFLLDPVNGISSNESSQDNQNGVKQKLVLAYKSNLDENIKVERLDAVLLKIGYLFRQVAPSTSLVTSSSRRCARSRLVVKMAASVTVKNGKSVESIIVKPPVHPTYDLKGVIKLALSEDAGDKGDVTCLATIPTEMEAEAFFLAKDDGIVAGVALAEMIFNEVDPTLKVEWFKKDGDSVSKGMKFGKVHGRAHSIVVAERVVLNFMQRMSGIATLTKVNVMTELCNFC